MNRDLIDVLYAGRDYKTRFVYWLSNLCAFLFVEPIFIAFFSDDRSCGVLTYRGFLLSAVGFALTLAVVGFRCSACGIKLSQRCFGDVASCLALLFLMSPFITIATPYFAFIILRDFISDHYSRYRARRRNEFISFIRRQATSPDEILSVGKRDYGFNEGQIFSCVEEAFK